MCVVTFGDCSNTNSWQRCCTAGWGEDIHDHRQCMTAPKHVCRVVPAGVAEHSSSVMCINLTHALLCSVTPSTSCQVSHKEFHIGSQPKGIHGVQSFQVSKDKVQPRRSHCRWAVLRCRSLHLPRIDLCDLLQSLIKFTVASL